MYILRKKLYNMDSIYTKAIQLVELLKIEISKIYYALLIIWYENATSLSIESSNDLHLVVVIFVGLLTVIKIVTTMWMDESTSTAEATNNSVLVDSPSPSGGGDPDDDKKKQKPSFWKSWWFLSIIVFLSFFGISLYCFPTFRGALSGAFLSIWNWIWGNTNSFDTGRNKSVDSKRKGDEEKSSSSGKEDEKKSSSSGKEDEKKSSSSGKDDEKKSSSSGKDDEKKSSSSGKDDEEKSSSSGKDDEERSSSSGKDYEKKSSSSGKDDEERSSSSGKDYQLEDLDAIYADVDNHIKKLSILESEERDRLLEDTMVSFDYEVEKWNQKQEYILNTGILTLYPVKYESPLSKEEKSAVKRFIRKTDTLEMERLNSIKEVPIYSNETREDFWWFLIKKNSLTLNDEQLKNCVKETQEFKTEFKIFLKEGNVDPNALSSIELEAQKNLCYEQIWSEIVGTVFED
jgi:hypothetical protein